MKLTDFLAGTGRTIAYSAGIARRLGSANAAIIFAQLWYWYDRSGGEFFKSADELTEETGLSYKEALTARKILADAGILQQRNDNLAHRIYFSLDEAAINGWWERTENPDCRKGNPEGWNSQKAPSECQKGNLGEPKGKSLKEEMTFQMTHKMTRESGSPDGDLFSPSGKSDPAAPSNPPPEPPAPPSQGTVWERAFDAAYAMFPTQRKGAQDGALRAWKAAKKRHPDLQPGYMLSRIKAYKDGEEVERGFAKGMAAWLNDDRWTFDYSRKPFGSVRPPTDGHFDRLAAKSGETDAERVRRQNSSEDAQEAARMFTESRSATR